MSSLAVLLKNRLRLIRSWRRVLRAQSRFKTGFILFFALWLMAALFVLFARGFRFLDALGQVGVFIMPRLLAVFFLGMALMLVVSGAITAYTTFFRSAEVPFLFVHPLRTGAITVTKAMEAAGLASWAFMFIIIPFILAYARHQGLTPWLAVWTLAMAVPFLFLCTGIGTLLTLLITRWAQPFRRRLWMPGLVLVFAAVIAWRMIMPEGSRDETLFVLSRLIPGFRLAANRFLPPSWMAEGILSFARGYWLRGFLFWGLMTSYAMVTALLIEMPGGRWFDAAWQRSAAAGTDRRSNRGPVASGNNWPRLLAVFTPATRAMIVKDIRTFLRDPAQWSQGLVFFGLLALYFSNLRTLNYHFLSDDWRSAIAFINMFSLSTVMCSLSSRFVFPQLSLEGQAFWLLGLAPVARGRILAAKVVTALTATLVISLGLMYISSTMLKVIPEVRWISLGIGAATACAFTGLSVGLGAVFMNLRQSNPAAIVSGFGGTLNLVLSLIFMVSSILPFSLVMRFRDSLPGGPWGITPLTMAWIWLVLLAAAATAVPLGLGYRSLRDNDY